MISTIQTTVLSLDVVDRASKQHLLPESQIRDIIKKFLHQCGLAFPVCPKHDEFKALCISEAIVRGYITAENNVFKRFIDADVSMACNAYPHQCKTIQIYICLYTAFLVYLDDMFENDIEAVKEFNHRFITHQPQRREILDHFSSLLLEMPDIFGMVQANMMITSTLNLVTALSLEYELKDIKLEPSAYHYPTFSRVMSGASETYSLFIYPPELALKKHLQALPDCMVYINNGNDILSFYKEDLSGETTNRVYMLAQCRGVSQETVLEGLIDEAVESHKRVLQILKADKDAYDAYASFSQGYIGFHAGLKRYKLDELKL